MVYVGKESLGGVGEGAVPDVMQKNGKPRPKHFFLRNINSLYFQHFKGTCHQIQGTQHVAETSVDRSGIHQAGKSQLLDTPLSLEIGVRQYIENYIILDGKKPVVHGVVDNLPLISHKKDFSILLNLLTENDVFYCLSSRKKHQLSAKT